MSTPAETFAVAAAIGFVLGFERERHAWREGEPAPATGARTFVLVSLGGALAGSVGQAVVAVGLAAVAALTVVGYWRTSEEHRGLTTEMTALVAFLLGAYCTVDLAVAAGIAVAVALVLEQKERVRHLLRDVITDVELDDALRFVAMALVVLPFLPHRAVDRWGVIDPYRVWSLVVVLAGIGWLGYVASRVLGPRRGLVVAGLAGGFVSGSATTAMMARTARTDPAIDDAALAAALAASVATCLQVVAITAVVDAEVGQWLAPAMLGGAAALAVEVVVVARRARTAEQSAVDAASIRRPLQLATSLLIAAVLTVTLVVSKILTDRFGSGAAVATAAVAGLADVHAAAIGAGSLAAAGDITRSAAIGAVGAALAVNTVVKLALAATAGGRRFAKRLAIGFLVPTAVVAAGLTWAGVSA